jgi:hypothetical protein
MFQSVPDDKRPIGIFNFTPNLRDPYAPDSDFPGAQRHAVAITYESAITSGLLMRFWRFRRSVSDFERVAIRKPAQRRRRAFALIRLRWKRSRRKVCVDWRVALSAAVWAGGSQP